MKIKIGRSQREIQLDEDIWETIGVKGVCVNITTHGYVRLVSKDKEKCGYLHRFIMKPEKGLQVDHINGDRLDNRRQNLRICSNAENNRNKKPIGKYKGVSYDKVRNLYHASICKDYKGIYIGAYKTAELAAEAYNKKAKQIHGGFAYLNRIES